MSESDFIWRFTPSRTEPQVLEDIFVQRQSLLTDLMDRILESATTGNKHHVLLVGPRGIGKTHLISLLHHRVTRDEELAQQVRIAWLLEDETITSFVQLLKRIFQLLADEYPAEFSRPWLDDLLQQTPAQIQKALEAELIARFSNQTLLLFIENLDSVFDGLGEKGQRQWRAFLQEHPFTTLVATSQRLFHGVQGRNQPFFGFFAPIHLKPLVIDDAVELLRRIAAQRRQADLSEFLQTPEGRSRVHALHHLAGGNHRIYIVLSGFITRDSLDELVQPFEKMADELTPYYQERLRWLSAQQRQIVEFLCTRESPCTPKEIARQLLAAENTISSQLKKLLEYGYLTKNPRGRESLYELTEPLMRLASEVKDKRRKPLRLLVDFLRVWYRPDQLPRLLSRAGTDSLRAHLSAAIADSQSNPDPRLRFLQADIVQAKAEGRLDVLVQALEERAHARGVACDWFALAYYHARLDNHEAALECLDKALLIDPKSPYAWNSKGISLNNLGRYDAALEALDKALAIDPKLGQGWHNKGSSLSHLGHHEAAIECYDKANEIDPKNADAWSNKGASLASLGLYETALECLDKALAIDPKSTFAWNNKGISLNNLGRYDAALDALSKALAIDPKLGQGWHNKGSSLSNLGRHEAAIECYDKALETAPNDAFAWSNKGASLASLGLYETALECLDKALEIDPKVAVAWNNKGHSLNKLDRYEAALECLDKALEIDPKNATAWNNKGRSLNNLGHYESALECLDKALEIDPKNATAWNNKGVSLRNLSRYAAALECHDKALELDPKAAYAWNEKGLSLDNLGRYEAALECYNNAIKITPNDEFPAFNRVEALFALHRWEAGYTALREAFLQHAENTKHDMTSLVHLVAGTDQFRRHVARLIKIFTDADKLTALGEGLVRSLKSINAEMLSEKALQTWRDAWLELGCDRAELEIPLRLFRVGIEYLIQQDERVLLDLVATERTLLRQALALDSDRDHSLN